jgi:AbrB family looped-hinge helix DNA binding protein
MISTPVRRAGRHLQQWYRQTMQATIDAGGRVVVPKEVRERLGLRPGSRVELTEVEGHLEISPAATPARLVDHDGVLVAVTDTDLPVLTAEQVRDAVEATRR